MLFHTWTFAVFLVLVLGSYYALQRRGAWRLQNALLLAASYVFYGWWDARFLSLIVFSTVVDYAVARALSRREDARSRRAWLLVSLVTNLGLLGVFKYHDFFVESAATLLDGIGLHVDPWLLGVALPGGVSFYTFQTLSYTIDVYRRQLEPEPDLLTFALFVSFFPQLVAGPIERARHLLAQLAGPRKLERSLLGQGAWLIPLGLFKKVVLADNLAPLVDEVYSDPATPDGATVWLATDAFAIQIYCDLSVPQAPAHDSAPCRNRSAVPSPRSPTKPLSPWACWFPPRGHGPELSSSTRATPGRRRSSASSIDSSGCRAGASWAILGP